MYSCEPSHVHEWLSRAEGAGPAPRICLSCFWSSPCRPRKKLAISMGQARAMGETLPTERAAAAGIGPSQILPQRSGWEAPADATRKRDKLI